MDSGLSNKSILSRRKWLSARGRSHFYWTVPRRHARSFLRSSRDFVGKDSRIPGAERPSVAPLPRNSPEKRRSDFVGTLLLWGAGRRPAPKFRPIETSEKRRSLLAHRTNSVARTAWKGLGNKPAYANALRNAKRAGGQEKERIFLSRRRLRAPSGDKDARTQAPRSARRPLCGLRAESDARKGGARKGEIPQAKPRRLAFPYKMLKNIFYGRIRFFFQSFSQ